MYIYLFLKNINMFVKINYNQINELKKISICCKTQHIISYKAFIFL